MKDLELINAIDWDITPEEAVRLYLEWGNNWSRGYKMIRSKDDVSHYFVLNYWEERPVIYLVRRNSEEVVELARIELPDNLVESLMGTNGISKGIYSVEGEIKEWLKGQLNVE